MLTGEPFSPFTATPLPTPGGPCQWGEIRAESHYAWYLLALDISAAAGHGGDSVTHPFPWAALVSLQKTNQSETENDAHYCANRRISSFKNNSTFFNMVIQT